MLQRMMSKNLVFFIKNYNLILLHLLVSLGALPEPNKDGMNPLHVAAQEGKREILFYLLKIFSEETDGTIKKNRKITIDIDLVDIEGNTCLHLAARRCQIDADAVSMVKMLIEKG